MRTSFPSILRQLVLVGLSPLPLACGSSGNPTNDVLGKDASTAPDAGFDAAPVDGSPDGDTCDAGPLEAGLEYRAACCFTGGACCHGPVCDPNGFEHPDAGDACAPRWIDGDGCQGGTLIYPCGLPSGTQVLGGNQVSCTGLCLGATFDECQVREPDGGPIAGYDGGTAPVELQCSILCLGRRPDGMVEPREGARTAGEVLARAAYLEAASVDAFLDLAVEMERLGAPSSLVRRLRRAAGDEERHARAMGALAKRRGAAVKRVEIERREARSLLAIALENAREGCVRETWGAASAVAQASLSRDADVREAMAGIASDELRHAALSWDLARWVESKLDDEARAQVAAERMRAVAELEEELAEGMPEAWRQALGFPSREEARGILAAMRAKVWASA